VVRCGVERGLDCLICAIFAPDCLIYATFGLDCLIYAIFAIDCLICAIFGLDCLICAIFDSGKQMTTIQPGLTVLLPWGITNVDFERKLTFSNVDSERKLTYRTGPPQRVAGTRDRRHLPDICPPPAPRNPGTHTSLSMRTGS